MLHIMAFLSRIANVDIDDDSPPNMLLNIYTSDIKEKKRLQKNDGVTVFEKKKRNLYIPQPSSGQAKK